MALSNPRPLGACFSRARLSMTRWTRRRRKRSFLSGVGDGAARGAYRRAECVLIKREIPAIEFP